MTSEDLTWETLADFSAGIFSDNSRLASGQGGAYPLGAAQEQNTYRCRPLPGGGLGPMPRRTKSYSRVSFDPLGSITDPPGQQYVTGFYVGGPVLPRSGGIGSHPELFFSTEYIFNNAGTPQRRYRAWRYRGFETAGGEDMLKLINSAETNPASAYRATTFAQTRSNKAAPLDPGIPVIVLAWYAGSGANEKFVSTFPNDATPTSGTPFDVNTNRAVQVFTHQGRIVALRRTDYDHGPNAGWSTNEDVFYTAVNNASAFTQNTRAAVFSYEKASGYGTWATLSANELLLVKVYGGALTVNGDLDNPTIVNLPNVTSTGGVTSLGTPSPLGYCYTSYESGLWAWTGGDQSEFLSPQLRGNFWHTNITHKYLDHRGQWASWGEWVVGPNNWVLDTVRRGWWRLDSEDVSCWAFQPTPGGAEMWGAVGVYTDLSTPIAYGWDRTLGATSWSWQSHTMNNTIDRVVNVRELVLVVQGTGTITVTLTSDLGSRVEVFSGLASDNSPVTFRRNTALYGARVAVRIESTGGAATAPILHELRIGMDERMKVRADA